MDLRTNLSLNRSLDYEVHSSSLHTLHSFTPHGWWLSKMDSPQQLHAYVWSVLFMVWSTLSINVAVNVSAVLYVPSQSYLASTSGQLSFVLLATPKISVISYILLILNPEHWKASGRKCYL